MVHECAWTWITRLRDKLICSLHTHRIGNFAIQDLPEEILIDILSRLPEDSVLECRRVCKQLLALTSTPHFVEMHLKRATPVLLLQGRHKNCNKVDIFTIDEGAKANQMYQKMGAALMHLAAPDKPILCGSCNGLLVFCHSFGSREPFVCNPLTGERITIRSSVRPVSVCGFFFHPIVKDYRLLFRHREGNRFEYSIYSLGNQLWRKLDDFSSYPGRYISRPAILNGALHWMVQAACSDEYHNFPCNNSIMIFNMDAEKFHYMPHPGLECSRPSGRAHKDSYIFEMKGKLAFCSMSNNKFVYVWVLEDYEKWIWVEGFLVNLHLEVKRYPFKSAPLISHITLLDIQDNELLFDWGSRGVFRYNMSQKTVKQISGVGAKKMLHFQGLDFGIVFPYIKTFVSPSDFK